MFRSNSVLVRSLPVVASRCFSVGAKANKVALITGSTTGMGKVMAIKFAKNGFDVVITGLGKQEIIDADVEHLKSLGVNAKYIAANLMLKDDCKNLVKSAFDAFGRVDVVINNAGMQHVAPIEEFGDDKWDNVIALNLSSCFHITKAVLPIMRKHNWGRIINIASLHGLVASPNKSAYVAAKHGLLGLTKTTALETAKENITCNAICPGWVYTPLVEMQIAERAKAKGISFEEEKVNLVSEKHPSGKFVECEDLASMAFFLASDSAKEMRGGSYVMDGGWSAI
jgi:3-hydroxybutyrate dehydrogenase